MADFGGLANMISMGGHQDIMPAQKASNKRHKTIVLQEGGNNQIEVNSKLLQMLREEVEYNMQDEQTMNVTNQDESQMQFYQNAGVFNSVKNFIQIKIINYN